CKAVFVPVLVRFYALLPQRLEKPLLNESDSVSACYQDRMQSWGAIRAWSNHDYPRVREAIRAGSFGCCGRYLSRFKRDPSLQSAGKLIFDLHRPYWLGAAQEDVNGANLPHPPYADQSRHRRLGARRGRRPPPSPDGRRSEG